MLTSPNTHLSTGGLVDKTHSAGAIHSARHGADDSQLFRDELDRG
jgi:hypothetical protein